MKKIVLVVPFLITYVSADVLSTASNVASNVWHFLTKRGDDDPKQKLKNKELEDEEDDQVKVTKSLSELYEERKAIFEKQQKAKEKKQLNEQKTKPVLVVFGSQKNSTDVEKVSNDIVLFLQKIAENFKSLSQDLSSNLSLLKTDDDINNEMEKSILIIDVIKRTVEYLELLVRGMNEINSGVAVLRSTSDITDDSYAIGCNKIIQGLAIVGSEKSIDDNIRKEMDALLKKISSRRQNVFVPVFEKHATDLSEMLNSIKTLNELYENEICPKIKSEDLATSFCEKQQSIRHAVSLVSVVVNLLIQLSKYYRNTNDKWQFDINNML